jgi:hypothetical protein
MLNFELGHLYCRISFRGPFRMVFPMLSSFRSFPDILQPCAFIAADYVLLGRLARYLNSPNHLLVPPHRITVVFIVSDVVTFLIQAAGGSATISANDQKRIETGQHVCTHNLLVDLPSPDSFGLDFPCWPCSPTCFILHIYCCLCSLLIPSTQV